MGFLIFGFPNFWVSPTYLLKSILLSWKSSTKVCIFISWRAGLSYLEVALLIRQSGGTYSYWYEAYGRIPAFLICWFWSVIGKSQKKHKTNLKIKDTVPHPLSFPFEGSKICQLMFWWHYSVQIKGVGNEIHFYNSFF